MIVPAEKELRAVLARFAQASIEHDGLPTARSGCALEDATYKLCVMTGTRTVADRTPEPRPRDIIPRRRPCGR
ncbi:DUF5133 domain-containing protein [Streptomyces sp. NPDC057623]|uniref:DUF5133 domain-containing protein n=1 Tax=Streptomyces sp. NPDC057623 TaxID=3346187 RepID=UPI0036BBE6F7